MVQAQNIKRIFFYKTFYKFLYFVAKPFDLDAKKSLFFIISQKKGSLVVVLNKIVTGLVA